MKRELGDRDVLGRGEWVHPPRYIPVSGSWGSKKGRLCLQKVTTNNITVTQPNLCSNKAVIRGESDQIYLKKKKISWVRILTFFKILFKKYWILFASGHKNNNFKGWKTNATEVSFCSPSWDLMIVVFCM